MQYEATIFYGDDEFFFIFTFEKGQPAAHFAPPQPDTIDIDEAYKVVDSTAEGRELALCPLSESEQYRLIIENPQEWIPAN